MRTAALLPLLAVAAAGCRTAPVAPLPFAGPVPRSLAVWPLASGADGEGAGRLLVGLDRAARGRGYPVPATEVTYRMLFDGASGAPAPGLDDLAGVGRTLDQDALLVLDVRRFEAVGEPLRSARWDLHWRVLSLRGHGELWSYEHVGSWHRRPDEGDDPLRRPGDGLETVPIGGDRSPYFRSEAELAAELHHLAMEHLPPCRR